jgi:hypothetical protein
VSIIRKQLINNNCKSSGELNISLCYNSSKSITDATIKMAKRINLYAQIEKHLPTELVNFMQSAGQIAASQGQNLYLVGGVVRDLLLGKANFDLDLVIEGDAINLAH